MYEYTSAVFAVGLEGFAPVDNDQITTMAADGWEPTQMASIHGGFAAVVLFRREVAAGSAPAPMAPMARARKAAAPTKAGTARNRKVPPPAAPTRATRTAAVPSKAAASSRAGRTAAAAAKVAPAARRTRGMR